MHADIGKCNDKEGRRGRCAAVCACRVPLRGGGERKGGGRREEEEYARKWILPAQSGRVELDGGVRLAKLGSLSFFGGWLVPKSNHMCGNQHRATKQHHDRTRGDDERGRERASVSATRKPTRRGEGEHGGIGRGGGGNGKSKIFIRPIGGSSSSGPSPSRRLHFCCCCCCCWFMPKTLAVAATPLPTAWNPLTITLPAPSIPARICGWLAFSTL